MRLLEQRQDMVSCRTWTQPCNSMEHGWRVSPSECTQTVEIACRCHWSTISAARRARLLNRRPRDPAFL